jgi:hypothetical protein
MPDEFSIELTVRVLAIGVKEGDKLIVEGEEIEI